MNEKVIINDEKHKLYNSRFACETRNVTGVEKYFDSFCFEYIAEWNYSVKGVSVIKKMAFEYRKNSIAIQYIIENKTENDINFAIDPTFSFNELALIKGLNQLLKKMI